MTKFPFSDFQNKMNVKQKGVEFVSKEYFVPKENSALCSLHFKESYVKKGKTRTRLISGALPREEDRYQEPFRHPIHISIIIEMCNFGFDRYIPPKS